MPASKRAPTGALASSGVTPAGGGSGLMPGSLLFGGGAAPSGTAGAGTAGTSARLAAIAIVKRAELISSICARDVWLISIVGAELCSAAGGEHAASIKADAAAININLMKQSLGNPSGAQSINARFVPARG